MTPQMTRRAYADDVAEIHQAALDYMQGWYEGDAERISHLSQQQRKMSVLNLSRLRA